jgi:putative serine protease PepD
LHTAMVRLADPVSPPPPMPSGVASPVVFVVVEFDEGEEETRDDDGPLFAWLPPDDRLWRHPSEAARPPAGPPPAGRAGSVRAPALGRPGVRVWGLAMVAGLAGALFASGFFMATGITSHRTTVLEPIATPATVALAASSSEPQTTISSWPSIDTSMASSVVAVHVNNEGNLQVGSGVLYAFSHDESYILTAQDLVANGGTVLVDFTNGQNQRARVVGTDPLSGIAVLATPGTNHSLPTFGSVSNVQVAEQVLAVGTPLADSSSAVNLGAVSGLDQSVTTGSDGADMDSMVALSGITVPSTSDGGALVDPHGEVVGIDTDITSTDTAAQGVAYAVPIDVAEHVANQLLSGQRLTHPWVGVDDAADLTSATARQLGVTGGAQVEMVDYGSPAAAAGLQVNDVVTAFNGQPVASSGALVTLLSLCQPGRRAPLTYFHGDRKKTVSVIVGNQPQS